MTSSAWSMYWQLESSSIFGRDTPLSAPIDLFESFYVGKARLAQQAARGTLTAVGDLGFE
jgi:hypothetical protein